MAEELPRILILGAHPDDVDIKAGGTAAKWCDLGFQVYLVSLTNGHAGHQLMSGRPLAGRRKAEARAAGAVIGATYDVFDYPDGELDDRLEYRQRIIRLIRDFRADLVITHRIMDYHPDHRFAGLLVQDASYLVTVPAICPETPHLDRSPVIMCFSDNFRKPCRFEPEVIVDIGSEFERVVDMLHCHVSQFYEWLPYNGGQMDQVPTEDAARRNWLAVRFRQRIAPLANRYREQIVQMFGREQGERIELVEAFEVSEYVAPLDAAARARLFPFVPPDVAGNSFTRKDWVDLPED